MLLIRGVATWDSTGASRAPDEWWIGAVAAGHSDTPFRVLSRPRLQPDCADPGGETWR